MNYRFFVLMILFISCYSLNSKEKELKYIETAPLLSDNNIQLNVFEDENDSLYFILTDDRFNLSDTMVDNYKELEPNNKYKLSLEKYDKVLTDLFYIRGGRLKYFYYDYIKNDTFIGNVYTSPNIKGYFYTN